MTLLVDLFGYLSIVVHGLTIVAQSMALGGALFLLLLAQPLADGVPDGRSILRSTARIAGWSAVALVACEAATVALQGSVLVDTVGLPWSNVLAANFAMAGVVKCAAAAVLAGCLLLRVPGPAPILLTLGCIELAAATLTTHAAARMDNSGLLLAVEAGLLWSSLSLQPNRRAHQGDIQELNRAR